MKNTILLVIDSLESDDALMRFDKVSQAVSLLKEALPEIPRDVNNEPAPVIGDFKAQVQELITDFERKMLKLREQFPELKEFFNAESA